MTEGRVFLQDVLVGNPLGVQEGAQDLVGRARIDIVGAEQGETLGAAAVLAHQVFDGRDRLLVRRRARIEDIAGGLLALILHRIEQEPVQLLEHRQHGLAADRGPAAEDDGDLLLLDQFARLLGEERPVRRRVDDHRLHLLAEQAALLVEVVYEHQHGVLQRRLADRHRARKGMQDSHLDRLGHGRRRRHHCRSGEKAGRRKVPNAAHHRVHRVSTPRTGLHCSKGSKLRAKLCKSDDATDRAPSREAARPDFRQPTLEMTDICAMVKKQAHYRGRPAKDGLPVAKPGVPTLQDRTRSFACY